MRCELVMFNIVAKNKMVLNKYDPDLCSIVEEGE